VHRLISIRGRLLQTSADDRAKLSAARRRRIAQGRVIRSRGPRPANAGTPVAISQSTAPRANMSVRASISSSRICSGDMSPIVPMIMPGPVEPARWRSSRPSTSRSDAEVEHALRGGGRRRTCLGLRSGRGSNLSRRRYAPELTAMTRVACTVRSALAMLALARVAYAGEKRPSRPVRRSVTPFRQEASNADRERPTSRSASPSSRSTGRIA